MAIHTISNNCVVVSISDSGAELQSIKSSDGREYLWQGSPAYWARRSPVLFPFVGALMNDSYTYCGNTYKMSQHGFARDMNFSFEGKDGSNISFVLNSDDKTFEIYPFDFLLRIEYSLNSNSVVVKWTVKNTGDKAMYYSIGAHPAFNLPDYCAREDCYIQLDRIPSSITGITGRYADEGKNVIGNVNITQNRLIKLGKDLFKNDALVFENERIRRVALCDGDIKPFVEVEFDAPVLGIWSPYKEGCPFVCIEPWYGRCDAVDFSGTLEERKWQNTLAPSESAIYHYTITVM